MSRDSSEFSSENLADVLKRDENNKKDENIAKPLWEATVLQKYPDLIELRERIRPLTKQASFARKNNATKTENKNTVSSQIALQLIMEYLDTQQHKDVIKSITEESKVNYHGGRATEGRLMTLIRLGTKRIEQKNIFANTQNIIQNNDNDETDCEVEVVDSLPGSYDREDEQGVNIWEEPPDSRRNIIQSKDPTTEVVTIRAATLNKLIYHLTTEKQKFDMNFAKTFFYTYQSFVSSGVVLKKLIERFNVPDDIDTAQAEEVRNRVVFTIKYWVDKCFWDCSEQFLSTLNLFIDGPLSRTGNLSLVKQLRNAQIRQASKMAQTQEYVFGANPPEPKVPKNVFSSSLTLTDIDGLEIARQITIIDYSVFCLIRPKEFLNACWTEPDAKRTAPHIVEARKRFQKIVNWVQTTVLQITESKRNRQKMIEKFLKIADHLRGLKNYQSFFAIMSALGSSHISPLGFESELSERIKVIHSEMISIIQTTNKFKNYRKELDNISAPCIPYLEVCLYDLTNIEGEYPNLLNNLINFKKMQVLFEVISTAYGHYQIPPNLQPVHQISSFLNNFPETDEKELHKMSVQITKHQ